MSDKELMINIEGIKPFDIFTNKKLAVKLLEEIIAKTEQVGFSMDCKAGRDDQRALAYKVARTKTYLDGIGKELVTEYKAIPKKIDECRKYLRDNLDLVRDTIRQPVIQWEKEQEAIKAAREAEEQRKKDYEHMLNCQDEAYEMHEDWKELQRIKQERLEREKKEHENRLLAEQKARLEREAAQREEAIKREAERRIEIEKEKAKKDAENLIREERLKEKLMLEEIEKGKAEARAIRAKAEHRQAINKEVIKELQEKMKFTEQQATELVILIYQGQISHLSINY